MSAYDLESVKRKAVGSGSGSDTDRHRDLAFTCEFAVADGHVVRVIVLVGRVVLPCRLGVRNVDERVVVSRCVIGELDVRDRQGIRSVVSAVAVDVELSGHGLSLAVYSQVQAFLLTDRDDFGDIVKQFNSDVAVHFVSRVDRFLKRLVPLAADLSHVILRYYLVRISVFRVGFFIIYIFIVGVEEEHPVAVVRFAFIFIRKSCEISAGDESIGRVVAVSVYVAVKESAGHRYVRGFRLLDRHVTVVDTAADRYVRTVTEYRSVERSAAQRVLSICETVAVGVIVERVSPFKRSAGHVKSRLHRMCSVGTRKLDPDPAVARRDGSSGNVDDVLFSRAVGKFSDRNGMRLYGTAGDVRYRVSGGRVVVDRIGRGTGRDILDKTAFNVKDTRVADRVGSVAAGIVFVSAVDPGVGRTGNQFTRSLRAAVLDRKRSFVGDERGSRALSGSSDDLKSVKVDRDISACGDRDRGSDYVDRLVVDHSDRGRRAVGDSRYRLYERLVLDVSDLRNVVLLDESVYAASLFEPVLVFGNGDRIIRRRYVRDLGDAVAAVRGDFLRVVADECSSGNGDRRRSRRIVAAVNDERVAGRFRAVCPVFILGLRIRSVERTARNVEFTGLDINSRCAGDRTAGYRRRSAARQIDRSTVGRQDRAVININRSVFRFAAVGRDGKIVAAVDRAVNVERLVLGFEQNASAVDRDSFAYRYVVILA